MTDISPFIMVSFGVVFGMVSGILPNRQRIRGRFFDLQQDWKYRVTILWASLVALLLIVTLLTEVTFRWVPFLIGFFVAGMIARLTFRLIFTNNCLIQWTYPLRSLYVHEPHRHSRFTPQTIGSILDLVDHRATQFSLSSALAFAYLSWIVYRRKDEVDKIAAEWNTPIIFIE